MTKTPFTHIFSYFLLFGFGVFILFISFIRTSNAELARRVGASPSPISHITLQTLANVPSHTDFQLPWPGILPTHPLYKLKMLRDKLRLILTTNPDRKAEDLLIYANKRIAAAHQLLELGQLNPAITVALKAESYLFQAAAIHPNLDLLKKSALKHEEIIEELILLSKDDLHNQSIRMYENLEVIRNTIISRSSDSCFGYPRPEDQSGQEQDLDASPSADLSTIPEPRL